MNPFPICLKIIFLSSVLNFNSAFSQVKEHIYPPLPISFTDTLMIINDTDLRLISKVDIHSTGFESFVNGRSISFTFYDPNWNCKKISFVHDLPNPDFRKIDQRYLTKSELSQYKTMTLSDVKNLSSKGGCNAPGKVIYSPTLYLILENGNGYSAFEVRATIFNERID